MKYGCVLLFCAALLSACGGGGGGGSTTGGGPVIPTPTFTPTQPPLTNASGTVVDDQTGNAFAGAMVKLMPWTPCGATPAPSAITPQSDGCPTPLPSPQATTDASGHFTLNGVPNGHYILIIGNDTVSTPPPGYSPSTCNPCNATPSPAPFTVQATIHDNVTLTGGTQVLIAPTIPPIPTITPKAWETNGDYRIATLDASTEMPCYIAWQYQRGLRSLPLGSVDEWLMEQERYVNLAVERGNVVTAVPLAGIGIQVSGGTTCDASLVTATIMNTVAPVQARDVRTLWFGGQYALYSAYGGTNNEAAGVVEFPIDPRSYSPPSAPAWL